MHAYRAVNPVVLYWVRKNLYTRIERTVIIQGKKLAVMLQVHAHRAVNPVVFTVDAHLLCCMQLRISELSSKSQVHASRAVNPVDIHSLA